MTETAAVVRAPRLRLWPLATGTFAIGLGSFAVSGLVPTLSADLDITLAQAGSLVSVYGFTYAVSTPLLTLLVYKVPRRTLLLVSMLLFMLATAATALADSYLQVAVLRGLSAVAAGGFTPTATVMAARLAPPGQQGRAVATVFGGLTTATVLGAPAGNLLGPVVGYRGFYAIVAVLAAGAALFVALLVRTPTPATGLTAGRSTTAEAGMSRWVVLALGVSMVETAGALMVQTYASPLLTDLAGATGVALSVVLLTYGIAGTVGNIAGGVLADRFGPGVVLTAALVSSGVLLALLPVLVSGTVSAALVFGGLGLVAWAMNSPLQNVLLALAGRHGQLVVALNSSVIALGTGLGAGAGGYVLTHAGSAHVAWGAGGVMGVGALAAAVLVLCAPRRGPEDGLAPARPQVTSEHA